MKLECFKDRLREVANICERVAGKNLALPILSSVLLEAKGGSLLIKATNLDVGLEIEIPAKVEEEGVVAINASILGSFLNNINKEEKIKITTQNENLHLGGKKVSGLIKGFSADDFPIISRVKGGHIFSFQSNELVAGLKSVLYAAAMTDIKPEISSVYVYKRENSLVFVSTDSFRLAEKSIELKNLKSDFPALIIPFKNVAEIIRVFDGVGGEIKIEADKNQISLYTDEIHLTSRVIDGVFPDYQQIMPAKFSTEVVVDKNDLQNALKLANIFADKFNQINLKIKPKEGLFEIDAQNQDVGENTVQLEAVMTGEDKEVSFNAKYILDCFQTISANKLVLGLNDVNRAAMIWGQDDKSFHYLIMPVIK